MPSNYGRFVRTFPLRDRGSLGATMRLLPERREVSRYQLSPLQSWSRRFVAVRQFACGLCQVDAIAWIGHKLNFLDVR